MELVDTGETTHPLLMAFFQAQHLNLQTGGAVIAAWDILPGHTLEEWIEAARTLSTLPTEKKRKTAINDYYLKSRREHQERMQGRKH